MQEAVSSHFGHQALRIYRYDPRQLQLGEVYGKETESTNRIEQK